MILLRRLSESLSHLPGEFEECWINIHISSHSPRAVFFCTVLHIPVFLSHRLISPKFKRICEITVQPLFSWQNSSLLINLPLHPSWSFPLRRKISLHLLFSQKQQWRWHLLKLLFSGTIYQNFPGNQNLPEQIFSDWSLSIHMWRCADVVFLMGWSTIKGKMCKFWHHWGAC